MQLINISNALRYNEIKQDELECSPNYEKQKSFGLDKQDERRTAVTQLIMATAMGQFEIN